MITAGSICCYDESCELGAATYQGGRGNAHVGVALETINQSINVFNVLGGNWDPTDKKFSSVNSYRQDLLPTCKAFPKHYRRRQQASDEGR